MSADTTQDIEISGISLEDLEGRVGGQTVDDLRSLEHLSGPADLSAVHNSEYYQNLDGKEVGHVHNDLQSALLTANPDFEPRSPDLDNDLTQDQKPGLDTGFSMEFKT
ncbi:hypothetical protein N9Z27_00940 [Alphaproteobacteria bacterium]|nr:hypothetical protein [Alphaproteobacteria bacterium]